MRMLTGTIVSNKMNRTVVVRVDRLTLNAKYQKYVRASSKYKADVENEKAFRIGDVVEIVETRPLSKDKRWRVTKTVTPAPADPDVSREEIETV
jgi:small subunit ribosomal protein S17